MTKKQNLNVASFKAESWPVAIRPARLRKSAKPDRVLHLDVALALVSNGATPSVATRATRTAIL